LLQHHVLLRLQHQDVLLEGLLFLHGQELLQKVLLLEQLLLVPPVLQLVLHGQLLLLPDDGLLLVHLHWYDSRLVASSSESTFE
jgi:hypothetical protein